MKLALHGLLGLSVLSLLACSSTSVRGPAQDAVATANATTTPAHPVHDMPGMPGMPGMASGPSATVEDCQRAAGLSEDVNPAQQAVINKMVANRQHRLLHALWHADRAGLTNKENAMVVGAFGQTWNQEHSYCSPQTPSNNFKDAGYNPVGEDFLYMHRLMTESVRGAMIAQGNIPGQKPLQCIQGWDKVPDVTQWPGLPDADRTGAKSDQTLDQLKKWDDIMQSPSWLSTHSLSQLGMALEITTHNNLHMRYATTEPPAGFSGVDKTGGAPIPYNGKYPTNWVYDNPNYNWLADPYGAAVNPVFWKIHGYVDGMIDKWLANNHYTRIALAADCGDDAKCYSWKGIWTGDVPQTIDPAAPTAATKSRAAMMAGPPSPTDGQKTQNFNQQRMLKQWVGVLGAPPQITMPTIDAAAKAPASPPPADPFDYAVQAECSPQK